MGTNSILSFGLLIIKVSTTVKFLYRTDRKVVERNSLSRLDWELGLGLKFRSRMSPVP